MMDSHTYSLQVGEKRWKKTGEERREPCVQLSHELGMGGVLVCG